MGERLKVNNLYVYGITPISSFREQQLSQKEREANNKISLMVFMLVNVFFGIIGTFWLRMQNRKGEIGLRMALGAHRITLERYMYTEGLCLLAFTLPLLIIFAFNMVYMDQLDSYRQPLTFMRFLMTFGFTYLLMGVMICIGIWFPVRKAVSGWLRRRRCIMSDLLLLYAICRLEAYTKNIITTGSLLTLSTTNNNDYDNTYKS